MACKLVACSQSLIDTNMTADDLLVYIARVSNPQNQTNFETGGKLLRHCHQHSHWSIFEHAYMTVEITTTRAIARQILRHRSFTFQEFSQRYAAVTEFLPVHARSQDKKNRQSSLDNLSQETQEWWEESQFRIHNMATQLYDVALQLGIAKETARFLLPESAKTVMYMTGNVRSWINYLQLRRGNGTQLEHQEIANEIWQLFQQQFPSVASAMATLEST